MREKIFVSVSTALITAFLFWLINKALVIPAYISIPSGAVIAFELDNCPVAGWKEYTLAHGRFVRGVDRSGTKIDPDTNRKIGSHQGDEFKSHTHDVDGTSGGHKHGADDSNEEVTTAARVKTTAVGGEETRPKNVALLYCIKI